MPQGRMNVTEIRVANCWPAGDAISSRPIDFYLPLHKWRGRLKRPSVRRKPRDASKLSIWRQDALERAGDLTLKQRRMMETVIASHPKNFAADIGERVIKATRIDRRHWRAGKASFTPCVREEAPPCGDFEMSRFRDWPPQGSNVAIRTPSDNWRRAWVRRRPVQ